MDIFLSSNPYSTKMCGDDSAKKKFKEAGIPAAVYYPIPLNKQSAVSDKNTELPVNDEVRRVMSLPRHPYIIYKDTEIVPARLAEIVAYL